MPHRATANHRFDEFVRGVESELRDALSAALGSDVGRQATAEALGYAWEHWARVQDMDNPAGYLYVLGRDRGRRMLGQKRAVFLPVPDRKMPWVEPGLPQALASLPEQQRVSVMLLYCFEWTMSEVADFLDVSKSTVQTHAERGMLRLRNLMGVTI